MTRRQSDGPMFKLVLSAFALSLAVAPMAQARVQKVVLPPMGWDATAGAQHGACPSQLMGRCADIHAGVMENQIFEVDEFALQP